MSDIEIVHPVPVRECEHWSAAMASTFLGDPSPEAIRNGNEQRRRRWLPDRRWGARADGRWVATLASFPTPLSVPGGVGPADVSADALSMVTVAATHKRRGILTAMLTDSLHAAHERGEAVSILFAAEWPIYGRFGYAPASLTAEFRLAPRLPGAAVPQTAAGTVREVDAAELGDLGPKVFAAARHRRAGNIDRDLPWWQRTLGLDGLEAPKPTPRYVVHEGPDGVDGFTAWAPQPAKPNTLDTIRVSELQASNEVAYRGLWEYLTRLDLIEAIEFVLRPVDEPVRWLLPDGRSLRHTMVEDGLWLRLLDVPAALSARRYATEGRLRLEVVDGAPGGYAAGTYLLDGGPDGAECTRSAGGSADLRLDQRALAASYLGGFSLRERLIAGQVEELAPRAVERADAMLATGLAPWCATDF